MDRAEAIKRLDLLLWLYDKEGQDKNYDAVKTAIAALREQEQSKWISVDERLPKYNELVLVVWVKHDQIRRRGFGTLQREGVWYVSNEGMPPVTHWMPLPEPPKEGADHE